MMSQPPASQHCAVLATMLQTSKTSLEFYSANNLWDKKNILSARAQGLYLLDKILTQFHYSLKNSMTYHKMELIVFTQVPFQGSFSKRGKRNQAVSLLSAGMSFSNGFPSIHKRNLIQQRRLLCAWENYMSALHQFQGGLGAEVNV